MSAFFEPSLVKVETPEPPTSLRSLSRKIKKNTSKKREVSAYEDPDNDSSENEKSMGTENTDILWTSVLHSRPYLKRPNPTSPKDTTKKARKRTLSTK